MGKRSRKAKPAKSLKTKFVLIGIIAAVIGAIIAVASLNPDAIKADNPSSARLTLDTRSGSPVMGDTSAPITIVEFGDYQCPFCKRWNETTKPAIEKNLVETGKVSFIYVDFPIIGPNSMTVHAGSYCAAEQGLYWQYHDYVYANQGHENDGWANSQNLKLLMAGLDGIDTDLFSSCLDSKKYEQQINENKLIAAETGISSTPSFIIIASDGTAEMIVGAQPYSAFTAVIDEMNSK